MLASDPRRRGSLVLAGALTAAALSLAPASAIAAAPGALYTQTNNRAGNAVQVFDRAADGSLSVVGTFATGGAGLATLGGRSWFVL